MVKLLSSQNDNKRKRKTIALAITGIACIIGYFFLVTKSPTLPLLKPQVLKEKILAKAESFSRQWPHEGTRFKRSISAEIDKQLLQYAQYYKKQNGQFPDLTAGYWLIVWKENKHSSQSPHVMFDFKGNLIGFKMKPQQLDKKSTSTLSEEDAEMEANYFLEELNIETNKLVITNKDITESETHTIYKFTLRSKKNPYPHLTDTYNFEIIGDRIVAFKWKKVIDPDKIDTVKMDQEQMIGAILLAIVWLVIILIILTLFIKKLRKDELEFKRAIGMGIFAAVLGLIMIMTEGQVLSWEFLLGGGILGVVLFLGILIVMPTAEAWTRETWAEKLEVTDLLLQGKGRVQETGTAILHSFFLTGLTLLLVGGLFLTTTSLGIGYLTLEREIIHSFQTLPHAVAIICKNILYSLFIGFTLLSFWPGYLKSKIPTNKPLFIFLLALTFDLGGMHFQFFAPPHLGALMVFPIALIWAYAVYKLDLLTILLSFFGVRILLDLALILLVPENLFSLQGMAVIIFTVLFFILGIYLVFRPRSTKDYEAYVPEYVSRIAEKERFLKELEIARGVQMRFLPQKVPQFPSLEIVSLCQPAMEVGGDYYDFIQVDERYMTVLIGDVSGKGVSAAFYMTMVKGIIKTLSKKTKDPATLLAEANEIFYENAPRDVFITIIYGIFDLKEKTLTIASAGHNPLIVWRHKTGKTEMINPKGIAIGLDHGERYRSLIQEKCIAIEDKDVFVFYTDGVSEAMNTNNEIFSEERLLAIIEKYAHLSPQQLQEKIVDAVSEFSGKAPQHDDLTMVVVKVRPK
jgi:sigma-B regulation protein RsbU (phosphoserine phosphatase)